MLDVRLGRLQVRSCVGKGRIEQAAQRSSVVELGHPLKVVGLRDVVLIERRRLGAERIEGGVLHDPLPSIE